jgi:hypothetical protein
MLDKIKSLWSKWKVQVSVVGGVLIVATAYGTCTYEAPAVESDVEPAVEETTGTETTGTETTTTETTTTETTTTESTSTSTPGTPTNADVNSGETTGEAITAEEK